MPLHRTRDPPAEICLTSHRSEQQTKKSRAKEGNKEMKLFKAATTVGIMALMGTVLIPGAKADDWDRKTVITFSGPVEIPGVHRPGFGTLPAGTYVFKIVDSQSDRHIVQIFSQDGLTVYATILAIPNYRLKATDKTVVTFRERPAGEPEAIRAWFYPGRNWGEEFVYPKMKAIEIAKTTNVAVLATTADVKEEVEKPEEPAVVAQLQQAPVIAVKPTGEEVAVAEVVTPPPAEPEVVAMAAPAAPAETALPETASPLPLIALLGLLALGGALALRVAERRV
jgi:hypothetical protein